MCVGGGGGGVAVLRAYGVCFWKEIMKEVANLRESSGFAEGDGRMGG